MGLLDWLRGAQEQAAASNDDIDTVRRIAGELDALEPERARYVACFAYILGRVAHADLDVSGEEVMALDVVGYDRNESLIRGFREAGFEVDREFFPVRCDNHSVLWELVRAGCGLGFAPAAQGRNDPALEEVDLGIPLPTMEVWLAAHEAVRRSPRVIAVWKLLEQGLAEACAPTSA